MGGYCSDISLLAAAGGMELLAAALDETREVAQRAFQVVWCLLDGELLPDEQVAKHEAELVRFGGLLRCSALFCPPHTAECPEQGMSNWR